MSPLSQLEDFEPYIRGLEDLATSILEGNSETLADVRLEAILNGDLSRELRRRVPLGIRQEIGAFFTGADLRARALTELIQDELDVHTIWDPACGAGDLLLFYAEHLPICADLYDTIKDWGKRLFGNDTQPLFLRAAKARLILAAYSRGARRLTSKRLLSIEETFPGLFVRDSLHTENDLNSSVVLLNPPYTHIMAPESCEWGRGLISAAAVFVDYHITKARPGTRIIAILPDVLRTGTRYKEWRRRVSSLARIRKIDIYGPFDPEADVDVFILDLTVYQHPSTTDLIDTWTEATHTPAVLSDLFRISVGPVVPHRHPENGLSYPYLHARNAKPWETMHIISNRRRFSGRVIAPPFVVVRRTSSPSDRSRIIGTIVMGNQPVAVENHLIVFEPYNNNYEICRQLLNVLRSQETIEWLNQRIRCRHLTTKAVGEIPWCHYDDIFAG